MNPLISLIVPIYNEWRAVGPFLDRLDALPGRWEVLFADGGSRDGTVEQITGRYPVLACPKGRARQMNAAAARARGEVLWFLHCDSRPPAGAYEQMARAVQAGAGWGCFHIRFDGKGPLMVTNALASDFRARRGIAFGDQGIFVTRTLFEAVGGFPDLPIMEDYEFSRRMKARKIPITLLPGRMVTSSRRYESAGGALGTLGVMAQMFYLRHLYRKGTDIQEIARRYRDIR